MLKLSTRFLLSNVYKRVCGIFFILFRSWVINKFVKNQVCRNQVFIFVNNSRANFTLTRRATLNNLIQTQIQCYIILTKKMDYVCTNCLLFQKLRNSLMIVFEVFERQKRVLAKKKKLLSNVILKPLIILARKFVIYTWLVPVYAFVGGYHTVLKIQTKISPWQQVKMTSF